MSINLAEFNPRRILVCQQRQIGDVLLATPALELLKKRFPDAQLHIFTEVKCEPLLRHNPHIDAMHLLDKKIVNTVVKQVRWYKNIGKEKFDLVIDFQQLPRCQAIVAFSRAPVRLSFPPRRLGWLRRPFYTHAIIPESGYAALTKVSLLSGLGIHWHGEKPSLYLTEAERNQARELLTSLGLRPGEKLITIDPTHRRITRCWPARHFARLLDLLSTPEASGDQPVFRFLLLRGPGEDAYVENLKAMCANKDRILLPKQAPDIRISAACIEAASLHIGNCSAPRHMAVALGTPSCIIPGSSGPEWAYPSAEHIAISSGLSCQPCFHNSCTHIRCMEELMPETVELHVRRLLLATQTRKIKAA